LEDVSVGNERVAQIRIVDTTNKELDFEFFTHGVDEHGRRDITDRNPGHITMFDNT
jgi:hypothetical protein